MLVWKTDWRTSDNHARSGSSDLARIASNYEAVANRLRNFGYDIALEPVLTDGYKSYPFADVLNALERNLSRIFVLPVNLYEGSKPVQYACGAWGCGAQRIGRVVEGYNPVTWYAMKPAPMAEDFNRLELNGRMLDQASDASMGVMLDCGMAACGEPLTRQLFGD